MRLYIAGPMTGRPAYNVAAFDAAQAYIEALGHDAVNPAQLDRAEGFDHHRDTVDADFMRAARKRDLLALLECDGIYLLVGWEHSLGAKAEAAVAAWAGLRVLLQDCSTRSVLEEAQAITSGDRLRDYDDARANHERIAGAWNWYLGARKEPREDITPTDAAMMMALLKVARIAYRPKRDSFVDLAGYARCAAQIEGVDETPLPGALLEFNTHEN